MNAARRPGSEPGGTSRARRFPGIRAKQDGLLSPDARVTFAAEREAAGIDEVFEALDRELVGLVPVKEKVEEIAALLLVDRARQRFGLSARGRTCTCASPGRRAPARPRWRCGWRSCCTGSATWSSGHLVHAMRDDLVGEYIGQTAPKTKRVLDRAMGGVLFIDEAYYLYRARDSKDYGQEAIEILLQVMENDRDKLVVILAGYKDRMESSSGRTRG